MSKVNNSIIEKKKKEERKEEEHHHTKMWQNLRACIAGSGADFFSTPEGAACLLRASGHLCPSAATASVSPPPFIAYIGTATYDVKQPEEKQMHLLRDYFGCHVFPIRVADLKITRVSDDAEDFLRHKADIIFVSGGNTSYAIRRWEETGLATILQEIVSQSVSGPSSGRTNALGRPLTLAGGSAGAICWCTSGHSDSANPMTYVMPSLLHATGRAAEIDHESKSTSWMFIRVHGLDIFPGFLCPHYDTIGDNGVSREEDFSKMLRRHVVERGVGLDHWAALVLKGDGSYEVVVIPPPSRVSTSTFTRREEEKIGVYLLDVIQKGAEKERSTDEGATEEEAAAGETRRDGQPVVLRRMAPMCGDVKDIFRSPTGAVIKDPFETFFAMANGTTSTSFPTR